MKKRSLVLLAFFTMAAILSCKKKEKAEPDDDRKCQTCVTMPEAKSENDNKSSGVYKAIITGSSGTIAFYIQNGSSDVKAILSFDGKTANLTTNYFSTWQPGTDIVNAQFSGTLDGKTITATFSVKSTGDSPTLSLNIPGHTISVIVFKETSQSLVKGFEGTYSGDESGVLNILLMNDEYTVIINGNALTRRQKLKDNKIEFTSIGTTVNGDFISENELRGTWSNANNQKGAWIAKRTL